ncbi:MAG: acetyl-CoA C-acyltransferase [Betaproteobacteria bacterium]|nr:acetyl-CoA C-acyltransferase [Betaproteobacteria bacterium]
MADAYVQDVLRTPRGAARDWGALKDCSPIDLLGGLFQPMLERNGADSADIDDVLIGCVTQKNEQAGDIARLAWLAHGGDAAVPAQTVNLLCASGLAACVQATERIRSGSDRRIIAGGVESMSRSPFLSDEPVGHTDPDWMARVRNVPTGVVADLLATRSGLDRQMLEARAIESHRRAARAEAEGRFASRTPVRDREGKVLLDREQIVRPDTSYEKFAKLEPLFAKQDALWSARLGGDISPLHHAGMGPGMADGAALVLIGERGAYDSPPRARIRACATTGAEPARTLLAAIAAAKKALARAGMKAGDIDLFECHEAWPITPILFEREWDLDPERVNVNGGCIAMGHPMGASGAIVLGVLLDELERQQKSTGLCCISGGAGVGAAMIIERC